MDSVRTVSESLAEASSEIRWLRFTGRLFRSIPRAEASSKSEVVFRKKGSTRNSRLYSNYDAAFIFEALAC
jgi:hypothetical protein